MGAISQTYTVPNSDNSADGDYNCMVTVSYVPSSESNAHLVTATGILTFQMIHTNSNAMHDTIYVYGVLSTV